MSEVPVGLVWPMAMDGEVIYVIAADQCGMLYRAGDTFDPAKYPELLEVLTAWRPCPKWSWRRPLSSLSAIIAWHREDDHRYLPYGGTFEAPRLPDLRMRR